MSRPLAFRLSGTRFRSSALLSHSRRLVFQTPHENNKRLEREKGDYMNLSTLICVETATALVTTIAIVAIIFGDARR